MQGKTENKQTKQLSLQHDISVNKKKYPPCVQNDNENQQWIYLFAQERQPFLNEPSILDSRDSEMMSLFAEVGSLGLFTFHSSRYIEQAQGVFKVSNNLRSVPRTLQLTVSQYD